jgi:hypothetical protein
MSRRTPLITTAALLAVCATPASAATWEDMSGSAPPPSSIAISAEEEYQDLRSPDAKDAAANHGVNRSDQGTYVLDRSYGSPDAVDAARDLPAYPTPTVATQPPAPIVTASDSSGGFDWGDAGIGAAGMFGLFGIAGGSALLLTGRKRRRIRMATH